MKELKLNLTLYQYQENELPAEEQQLVIKSREMARNAYAPYSNFSVGAALLLANGEIIGGNNQENAAYPSGLCAERVALFAAGANYPGVEILKMAITVIAAAKSSDRVYAPCGACRQVISEYQHKQTASLKILFEGPGDYITVAESIEDIMPFTFKLLNS